MATGYTESDIDYCLLRLYRCGGNAIEAAEYLRGTRWKDNPQNAPSAERLKRWRTGIHRARYIEIAQENAEDIEKEIVVRLRETATAAGLLQTEILETLMARVRRGDVSTNDLRTLAVMGGVSIDKLLVLSGRPQKIVQINNPDDIVKRLVEAGYAEVIDGTADEFAGEIEEAKVVNPDTNFAGQIVDKPIGPTTVRDMEKRNRVQRNRQERSRTDSPKTRGKGNQKP